MIAPCKDCTERYESCHSNCEQYKNWKKQLDEERATIIKAKSDDAIASSYRYEVMKRMIPYAKKKRREN